VTTKCRSRPFGIPPDVRVHAPRMTAVQIRVGYRATVNPRNRVGVSDRSAATCPLWVARLADHPSPSPIHGQRTRTDKARRSASPPPPPGVLHSPGSRKPLAAQLSPEVLQPACPGAATGVGAAEVPPMSSCPQSSLGDCADSHRELPGSRTKAGKGAAMAAHPRNLTAGRSTAAGSSTRKSPAAASCASRWARNPLPERRRGTIPRGPSGCAGRRHAAGMSRGRCRAPIDWTVARFGGIDCAQAALLSVQRSAPHEGPLSRPEQDRHGVG
jgi:hypothetical protein